MKIYFHRDKNDMINAVGPIAFVLKKMGFDVSWDLPLPPHDEFNPKRRGIGILSSTTASNVVYVPHGISSEDRNKCGDGLAVLVPGLKLMECYKKRWDKKYHDRFKLTGWAKMDLVSSPNKERIDRETKEKLNIPLDKVIVVDTSQALMKRKPRQHGYFEKVYQAAQDLDLCLVVKPSYASGQDFDWYKKKWNKAIWINPLKYSITDRLLSMADMVVSNDKTSTGIEALAFKKPLLVARIRFVKFPMIGGWKMENPPARFFSSYDSNNTVRSMMEDALQNGHEFDQRIDEIMPDYFYKLDGKSTQRSVNAIIEILKDYDK